MAKRLTDPRKRVELRNTRILRRDTYSRLSMQLLPRCTSRYYVVLSESRRRARKAFLVKEFRITNTANTVLTLIKITVINEKVKDHLR